MLTFWRAIACGATRMAIFAEILGPARRHYGSHHLRWTALTCPVFSQSNVGGVSSRDVIGIGYLLIPSARTVSTSLTKSQVLLAF